MTSIGKLINLDTFQTQTLIPLENRPADTYERKMLIEGNSILSSLFIESMDPGASIKVNYWDTSAGSDATERYELNGHNLVSTGAPITDRVLVTKIHNKPNVEVIVSGGSVKFGIYVTVVTDFASDIDSALVLDATAFQALIDKGMVVAGLDRTNDVLRFLSVDANGNLQFAFEGVGTPTVANVTMASANTEYSYTFPDNTKRYTIQNRKNGLVKFCFTTGETGTKYISLFPGQVHDELNITKDSLTIYFESPLPNQLLELLSWK